MKKKQKKEKWKMGSKIRDISTNTTEHRLAFMISIIVANIVLLTAGISYMVIMKEWYYIVIAIIILLLCGVYSYFCYKRTNLGRIYTLYDNCIILSSFWSNKCIRYENISLIDIVDDSLIIYEKVVGYTKTRLRYINEDLDKVRDEMNTLVNDHNEKSIQK